MSGSTWLDRGRASNVELKGVGGEDERVLRVMVVCERTDVDCRSYGSASQVLLLVENTSLDRT
jgi:hypothetical protein